MKIKRIIRILNIWRHGKLSYVKRYRRWLNGHLFRELQLLTPIISKHYVEKYGNASLPLMMEILGKESIMPPPQMFDMKDGKITVRDATPDEIGKPVTFIIPKQP